MHKNLEQYLPLVIEELSDRDTTLSIDERWKSVIEQFFYNSSLYTINGDIDSCALSDDGLNINIPAIEPDKIHQVTSNTAQKFSAQDVELTDSLLKLARQFVSVQQAIEQGANEERHRIARDLHDDVAARMLTLIHQAKDQDSIDLARSILKSLRNAIYTLDTKSKTTILDAITDIRAELQERLNSIGLQLFWGQPDNIGDLTFTPRQHINLQRILHETVTNVIRHADAQFMTIDIKIEDNDFCIFACDNGKGFNMDDCIPGKGINNITNRIKELNGRVEWSNTHTEDHGGSCLDIQFPITIK